MDSEGKTSKQEVLQSLSNLHQSGEISNEEIEAAIGKHKAEPNVAVDGSTTQLALMYVGVILIGRVAAT